MKKHLAVRGRRRRAAAAGGSILLIVLMVGLTVIPASATVFSNTGLITIPAGAPGTTSGNAAPYPSTIAVSGLSGTITDVNVSITGYSHTFPDDVDVLLIGPLGQNVVLMTDSGATLDTVNVNLTFDDAAVSSLPDATQVVSGTFKPTNNGAFSAPVPVGPFTNVLLSTFNGTSPNGTWNMFVFDDTGTDVGQIASGWSLDITTNTPTITSFSPTSGTPGTLVQITGTNLTGATSVTFGGVAATTFVVNSATQITATVPTTAVTGPIAVTTASGTATSSTSFTVSALVPTITSFSPTVGRVGDVVTITGTNLTGATSVKFDAVSATSFSVISATQVTATVPAGSSTGPISVTTPGGTGTSTSSFIVQHPRITTIHLTRTHVRGNVSVGDGFSVCRVNVPVKIQFFRNGGFHLIGTVTTGGTGSFSLGGAGDDGKYRAIAKRTTLGSGDVCLADTSNVARR